MVKVPTITLPSGATLPKIGYGNGTALFKQDSTKSVAQALNGGYTLIDTAEMYENSQWVGSALEQAQGKTQVIAKLGHLQHIRKSALEERTKLQRDRLDVLLLHLPPRGQKGLPSNVEAWKTMQDLKDEGVADVIGVSNWLASDIEEVLATKPKHPIQMNQIEHHPFLAGSQKQRKLLQLQKERGIATAVYSSLAPLTKFSSPETQLHQVVEKIAKTESSWTPATVLFKWASQTTPFGNAADGSQDGILITTTNKPERIPAYVATFESRRLSDQEVEEITKAGQAQEVKKIYMVDYFNGREE